MFGIFTPIRTEYEPGPELAIDCPLCGEKEVLAQSFRQHESITLLHLLPLGKRETTIIVCRRCQQRIYSNLSFGALSEATPSQVQKSLTRPDRFASIVFFIFAMLTWWVPCLGLIPAITVPVANRYARGVWRLIGFLPLFLALLVTVLTLIAVIW